MSTQKIHPVIYTTPICPACKLTKKWLKEKNITIQDHYYNNNEETNEIDILSENPQKKEWSEQKINKIKEKYPDFKSFPIVKVVQEDGTVIDIWAGFRPDKLRKYFDN